MNVVASGIALMGILLVAGLTKPMAVDALSWAVSKGSGYLSNTGGSVFDA